MALIQHDSEGNQTILGSAGVVGDTLPIGSMIDYDGTVVPDGWAEISDPSLKIGFASITKTSAQTIPATTVTAIAWHTNANSSGDGMVTLSGGNITFNSRIKFAVISYANSNSFDGNHYINCWGLSYPLQGNVTSLRTCPFYNVSGTTGTLTIQVYAAAGFTYSSDSYWNYVNVFYFYV